MAMQSGAMVVPEKIPVQWYNHHQQPLHHQMDERDGFLMWMRGEFAAANAIIDALCHHLRAVGEPGEYDGVIGSIQQRRMNWNPILHMQQYFSVADVVYALQQVGWRRQHKAAGFDGGVRMGVGGKEFRRGSRGQRGGVEMQNFGGEVNGKDLKNGSVKNNLKVNEKLDGRDTKVEKKDEMEEVNDKSEVNSSITRQGSAPVAHADVKEADVKAEDTGADGPRLVEKPNLEVTPKAFVATEMCDGKSVNIAEGLKLYENLFDDSEISKLNTLVSDLRAAGRRGQLPGHTFVISKRPMKGHGREMIQLGVPIADAPPEDEITAGTSKDPKIEPIPVALQDLIERLLTGQVLSIEPDSAIIDIFNEGDHSQPHIWPQWFGRPVCLVFLTECEMSFGKVLTLDHPGDYQGALRLSLSPGSFLVLQGRSADFARHAIPSIRKQRILVTLVKSQPRKFNGSDGHRTPSPSSNWAPPPSRSPSLMRPVPPKHFSPIPPVSALPGPTAHPQLPLPNGIQPMFVPTPVAPVIAFPTPVALPPASAGWPTAPLRHPPPRLLLPGTGVFLPPQGSGNSSNQPASTLGTKDTEKPSEGTVMTEEDDQATERECNGSLDKPSEGTVAMEEEKEEERGEGRRA